VLPLLAYHRRALLRYGLHRPARIFTLARRGLRTREIRTTLGRGP
jgi:hypothetical protein